MRVERYDMVHTWEALFRMGRLSAAVRGTTDTTVVLLDSIHIRHTVANLWQK